MSRTGLFGNVTIHWNVTTSDASVQTESYLHPSSGTISLLSGLY